MAMTSGGSEVYTIVMFLVIFLSFLIPLISGILLLKKESLSKNARIIIGVLLICLSILNIFLLYILSIAIR